MIQLLGLISAKHGYFLPIKLMCRASKAIIYFTDMAISCAVKTGLGLSRPPDGLQ